jgi:magnesium transporter
MAVVLVFFIPMLCGTGGNTGTQASTIVIRGLAVGEISVKHTAKILMRESLTGLVLGASLGIFGFMRAMLVQHSDPFLWITVGTALAATVIAGNLVGASLPFLAQILRIDPAVMAGPFISTIVDLTSLFIYFELAKRMLITH